MTIDKQALREMAKHRGLTLKASRRRKPGGDFGKLGLVDAAGKAVLGIGNAGLEASDAEVETFLRDATRATWKSSAGTARIRKAPPPPPKPPEPKPAPHLKIANLFARLPAAKRAEAVATLAEGRGATIERIVSNGQATPADAPMRQDHDEWVIVLQGEAGLRIEDSAEAALRPGDHILIAAGQRHWVTRIATGEPTVWLAVRFR
ncbi:cupin domain-containing protein [Sphingomonas sp.]|uniref:cupin domain-containing protein n=1 Tax=Sphingomonas sp. TaxID=28214 RepID=UPI0025D328AB|nr:cupin domain-containing protein [Sphingomonas sp.]